MYTNANFWRDVAAIGISAAVYIWSLFHLGQGVESGCSPSGSMCE